MISELTQLAIKAAIEASKDILTIYKSDDFEIESKEDNSPLTKADKAAHNIISSILQESKIPILSEEGKSIPYETRKYWNKLWIVDPIDGTKEFIKRNGEFTVNIALIENNKPVIGVILAPASGVLYFSEKNMGAFKSTTNLDYFNPENLLVEALPLPLNHENKVYTVVASRSHLSKETEAYVENLRTKHGEVKFISIGSSLKLCMVAEGKANCYPRFAPTMEWDTAAGQAICEAAGFQVLDFKTKKSMIYNREDLLNNWFIVI
ncbi:MAG: 3'(2'),5'-bisphosphate nucleotidase CysQ [Flavobacteriales bacterium]